MESITVKIGGEDITIPAVANFATLERLWPALDAYNGARDGIGQVGAACALLSAAVIAARPELTVAEIKNRLRINIADGSDERPGMLDAVGQLLLASGLVRKETGEGEAAPAEAEAAEPSTAILNTSSPN